MKLSAREMALAWVTLVAIVLGGTYWYLAPKWTGSQDAAREMQALIQRVEHAERLIGQRQTWDERIAALRKQLPQHPAGKDVTSELLKNLEGTARQHNLNLLRREPDKEKVVGDLCEFAIECGWEGELDALVRFLYAIQVQGVILDIRNLTVNPMEGAPGKLKGSFTIDVAYTRAPAGGQAAPAAGP